MIPAAAGNQTSVDGGDGGERTSRRVSAAMGVQGSIMNLHPDMGVGTVCTKSARVEHFLITIGLESSSFCSLVACQKVFDNYGKQRSTPESKQCTLVDCLPQLPPS
jgi:hypothetical protein